LSFFLESWGTAGGPNVYRKNCSKLWDQQHWKPAHQTSMTFVWRARHCHRLTTDLGVLWSYGLTTGFSFLVYGAVQIFCTDVQIFCPAEVSKGKGKGTHCFPVCWEPSVWVINQLTTCINPEAPGTPSKPETWPRYLHYYLSGFRALRVTGSNIAVSQAPAVIVHQAQATSSDYISREGGGKTSKALRGRIYGKGLFDSKMFIFLNFIRRKK